MSRTFGLALLACLPVFGQLHGILVRDIFGRALNQNGITLVDWDGYMANPAIEFVVEPPSAAQFPATAVLTADEQRLYFDLPSKTGRNGPEKTVTFANASTRITVFLGNAPDRDSSDGFYRLRIHFTGADGRTSDVMIPVHEIDQDRADKSRYRISADFSKDRTGFFQSDSNRAPVVQALQDWAYFFDDMDVDAVPAGREKTLIWGPAGFVSSSITANSTAFRGSLLYVYGIHSTALRSGGEPSRQGDSQTSHGRPLPLRRSGGVEIETAGNFNSIGWLTAFTDEGWWTSANLGNEQNELFSIAHHESGHAIAFNPALPEFAHFKQNGCLDDPAVLAYHHGKCLKIDNADHFDGEVDDASLFGAFGNEYHARVPARRWWITKLDLLAAQSVGWKLRQTSSLVPVEIVTPELPSGAVGRLYDIRLAARGGIPFYNWTIDAGSLPDGLHLDSFSGAISGTPLHKGRSTFTVRLQDYVKGSTGVTKSYSLVIE